MSSHGSHFNHSSSNSYTSRAQSQELPRARGSSDGGRSIAHRSTDSHRQTPLSTFGSRARSPPRSEHPSSSSIVTYLNNLARERQEIPPSPPALSIQPSSRGSVPPASVHHSRRSEESSQRMSIRSATSRSGEETNRNPVHYRSERGQGLGLKGQDGNEIYILPTDSRNTVQVLVS